MSLIGIDIGGTRIKAGRVDENGKLLAKTVAETPNDLSGFSATVASLLRELTVNGGQPSAVGVGCKGVVHTETTEVKICPGTFSFLEGVKLSDLIIPHLERPVPVRADNDARVALAGEVVWGAARGRMSVVMLTLGTGVGGAALIEGRILRGTGGAAGLFGHITIAPQGRYCSCGNRGCLETVFSASAIEAEALHAVHRGCESVLTERFKTDVAALNCKAVFDAAAEGDAVAVAIRDEAIAALGAGVAGLLHVFDPEVLILGGQIVEAGTALLAPLREELEWRTKRFLGRVVPVVLPEVEDTSGVVGAAALALRGSL